VVCTFEMAQESTRARRQPLQWTGFLAGLAAGLLLVSGAAPAAEPPEPAPTRQPPVFTFGLLADVQHADKPTAKGRHYRQSLNQLKQCVEALNRHELAFVVHLGDVIDGNATPAKTQDDLDRVLRQFAAFRARVGHVVGNHDLNAGRKTLLERLGLKRGYYDFRPEGVSGWRILVLDGTEAGYGVLGQDQLDWLRSTLADATGRGEKVLVCNHFALLKEAARSHRMKTPAPVLAILDQSDAVVAYFAGHDHQGGYARRRGVHHVTVQGMVEAPEQNAYAIVRVFHDRIELEGVGNVPSRIPLTF